MSTLASQRATAGPRGIVRKLLPILQVTLVAALLAATLHTFVVEAIYVPSPSMESTLLVGDVLFINKLVYGARPPALPFLNAALFRLPGFRRVERGDVILFDLPTSGPAPAVRFIKRCVAVAGDEVSIRHGLLLINGVPLPAPEATDGEFGPGSVPRSGDRVPLNHDTVDEWRELIEREGHAVEARADGEVLVDGLPASSYTVAKNYLFVLGDNRGHSYDSRHWGFLPEENVVGQAMVVYWSVDPARGIRWNRIGTVVR